MRTVIRTNGWKTATQKQASINKAREGLAWGRFSRNFARRNREHVDRGLTIGVHLILAVRPDFVALPMAGVRSLAPRRLG